MSSSSSDRPARSGSAGPVAVSVALDPDADAVELDDATSRLRDALLDLDVDAVDRLSAGEPPPGARAAESAVLAGLAVQVGHATLGAVMARIRYWVGQRSGRSVKVTVDGDTIEVTNVSTDDQHDLIEAFLARHA
jgi:hypothetical protein